MNILWQCYGWSVQNFFHYHNLPKDQTTRGHTWDQRQVAQWNDQSTEKDWYKTHDCLISSHHTQNWSKQENWLIKQKELHYVSIFPLRVFVADYKKQKGTNRGQPEEFKADSSFCQGCDLTFMDFEPSELWQQMLYAVFETPYWQFFFQTVVH